MLLTAAAEAAGAQQYPPATLYVVATPIGNLADLSLRAIHVLALVDAVACEDTRVSAGLLRHLGLDKPLIALHQHNEHADAGKVLQRLALGERVAYVSDAGTPAVSDPGAWLVAQAAARRPPRAAAARAEQRAGRAVCGRRYARRRFCVCRLPAHAGGRTRRRAADFTGQPADAGAVRGAAPHRSAGRGPGRRPRRDGR